MLNNLFNIIKFDEKKEFNYKSSGEVFKLSAEIITNISDMNHPQISPTTLQAHYRNFLKQIAVRYI